jgi:protocatechuate 3,4-dioxygenase beta subunit
MTRIPTPQLGRRHVIGALAVSAAASALPRLPALAAPPSLVPTPRQTTGPFYPVDWAGDVDNDLVVVRGEAARALGHVTHITGRILDTRGAPIAGAQMEIWQCDNNGHYLHPADRAARGRRDQGFQGRGRMVSSADGSYSFRTIKPVSYPGRTPHIHFAITTAGAPSLVTQMYVADEPLNERDGLLRSIRDARQREMVQVRLAPAEGLEPGALAGTFDIVLPTT